VRIHQAPSSLIIKSTSSDPVFSDNLNFINLFIHDLLRDRIRSAWPGIVTAPVNSELQGMWRNAVTDCFELFSRYFPGGQGTRENDAHMGGGGVYKMIFETKALPLQIQPGSAELRNAGKTIRYKNLPKTTTTRATTTVRTCKRMSDKPVLILEFRAEIWTWDLPIKTVVFVVLHGVETGRRVREGCGYLKKLERGGGGGAE
jgi:hypothetical protein